MEDSTAKERLTEIVEYRLHVAGRAAYALWWTWFVSAVVTLDTHMLTYALTVGAGSLLSDLWGLVKNDFRCSRKLDGSHEALS